MRTIKEIGIEELIPNEAGKNALKTASADVSTKEEGPKHIDWEKGLAMVINCCDDYFVSIRTEKK